MADARGGNAEQMGTGQCAHIMLGLARAIQLWKQAAHLFVLDEEEFILGEEKRMLISVT